MEVRARMGQPYRMVSVRAAAYRLGDLALFLAWVAQAVIIADRAINELWGGEGLAGAHHALVAMALFVNASLFVLRGPAVARSSGLSPKIAAFVGSWAMLPLASLPLTDRAESVLVFTNIGLVAVYGFVIWALLTLRRSFSVFPEARRLVRHGPYALVRHPLYAAYIFAYAFVALPRFGLLALALALLGIAGEIVRAHNEERVLARSFPEYSAYAEATPRFVPRVGLPLPGAIGRRL